MTPDLCLMCAQLPNALKCTLHGGHMTATEVQLRWRYQVSNGAWIETPQRDPMPSGLEPMFDFAFDTLKSKGVI
jgi:hypothetical protein